MSRLSRRHFLTLTAGAAALATAALPRGARAVVIGGGPGGATHALALARSRPESSVLLIERDPTRLARAAAPAFGQPNAGPTLDMLRAAGVEIVIDEVTQIDWSAQRAALFSGRHLAFDRLLLAPGTAAQDEAIPGLDAAARHRWPAAWGSVREARRLAATLEALPETGHLVLRLPAQGLAHPEAVLTRALDLSRWLATHRPAARFTVLDGGGAAALAQRFARENPLGRAAIWHAPGNGGGVKELNAARGMIETDAGQLRADAVNFLTPRAAGTIARKAGLTDTTGWCPVDAAGRSTLRPAALILGDARAGVSRTLTVATRLTLHS